MDDLEDELQEQYKTAIEECDPDKVFDLFRESNLILPSMENVKYMIEIHEKYEPQGRKTNFLTLYHDFLALHKDEK